MHTGLLSLADRVSAATIPVGRLLWCFGLVLLTVCCVNHFRASVRRGVVHMRNGYEPVSTSDVRMWAHTANSSDRVAACRYN